MKEIKHNIFVEDRYSVPTPYKGCNTSFIVTSEGIVLVDTPYFPTDARNWRAEVEKRGEIKYVINTDHHQDHATGNTFLPGTVIAHQNTRELFTAVSETGQKPGQRTIKEIVSIVRTLDPKEADILEQGYQPRLPSVTFSDRLTLYLGEQIIELIYLPGHTQSNINIYLPREKVLFTGDNFTSKTQPSLATCFPLDWVKSLKAIEGLDVDAVVPGHGKVSDGKEIPLFRAFIEECIGIVRDAIRKGMTADEAAAAISFEELYEGGAVHPGPVQQRLNVLRLYKMLSMG